LDRFDKKPAHFFWSLSMRFYCCARRGQIRLAVPDVGGQLLHISRAAERVVRFDLAAPGARGTRLESEIACAAGDFVDLTSSSRSH